MGDEPTCAAMLRDQKYELVMTSLEIDDGERWLLYGGKMNKMKGRNTLKLLEGE
ncbi:hypothetical protein QJS10_CPB20g00660 [Acorus calamus]|uniref:Uncharacterized protein n=1 Tax=Acorus calamus TaxID=4465 RepID=A0AAV9CC04_ACOCL|nr:hypothetical protein QJS10_CPB20g00660 [Acorus calamus]